MSQSEIDALNLRAAESVTVQCRVCGSCGLSSFGLERVEHNWREREGRVGVDDWRQVDACSFALQAVTYNPHLHGFVSHVDGKCWQCASCRRAPKSQLRSRHAPPLPADWALTVMRNNWEHLHSFFSLVNTRFQVQEHYYGYAQGTFDTHGVQSSPLLRLRGAKAPSYSPDQWADFDRLESHLRGNPFFAAYHPVYAHGNTRRPVTAVGPSAWAGTVSRDRERDPRDVDQEAAEGYCIMDMHTVCRRRTRAVAGCMMSVDGTRLGMPHHPVFLLCYTPLTVDNCYDICLQGCMMSVAGTRNGLPLPAVLLL